MNKEQFIEYLQQSEKLKEASLSDLVNLVKDFPYCQSARVLLTMKLYVDKNVLYDAELKTTSIYAGSRRILKKHIDRLNESTVRIVLPDEESVEINKPEVKPVQSQEEKNIEKKRTETVDPQIENAVDSSLAEKTIDVSTQESSGQNVEPEATARSYTVEELKKMIEDRIRAIEAEKKQKKKQVQKSSKARSNQDIIEDFIRKAPSISRPKNSFYDPVDYAKQSVVDQQNIVSETLANIYIDQGHYEKAIRIYEKLILKFPEKSTYFAALIKKAEKNLKN